MFLVGGKLDMIVLDETNVYVFERCANILNEKDILSFLKKNDEHFDTLSFNTSSENLLLEIEDNYKENNLIRFFFASTLDKALKIQDNLYKTTVWYEHALSSDVMDYEVFEKKDSVDLYRFN